MRKNADQNNSEYKEKMQKLNKLKCKFKETKMLNACVETYLQKVYHVPGR